MHPLQEVWRWVSVPCWLTGKYGEADGYSKIFLKECCGLRTCQGNRCTKQHTACRLVMNEKNVLSPCSWLSPGASTSRSGGKPRSNPTPVNCSAKKISNAGTWHICIQSFIALTNNLTSLCHVVPSTVPFCHLVGIPCSSKWGVTRFTMDNMSITMLQICTIISICQLNWLHITRRLKPDAWCPAVHLWG